MLRHSGQARIAARAGIQDPETNLDSRFRENDDSWSAKSFIEFPLEFNFSVPPLRLPPVAT